MNRTISILGRAVAVLAALGMAFCAPPLPALPRLTDEQPGALPELPAHFGRVEVVSGNAKDLRKQEEFRIGNTTQPRLDLREGAAADIQADQLAASCHFFLGQIKFVAQLPNLRTHDVCWCLGAWHAKKLSLTLFGNGFYIATNS